MPDRGANCTPHIASVGDEVFGQIGRFAITGTSLAVAPTTMRIRRGAGPRTQIPSTLLKLSACGTGMRVSGRTPPTRPDMWERETRVRGVR
jgi:hypothetical protein